MVTLLAQRLLAPLFLFIKEQSGGFGVTLYYVLTPDFRAGFIFIKTSSDFLRDHQA